MALAAQLKSSKFQPHARQPEVTNSGVPPSAMAGDDSLAMTSEKVGAKSVRLTLVLPKKSAARLDKLKEVTEAASYAEIIRNAIRVYEALVTEFDSGTKFFVKRKDDKDGVVEFNIF